MGSLGGFAHEVFELGKDLFDRVQVGRVWRQEQQLGSDAADSLAHSGSLVAGEIVHDDHIAGRQRGHKALFDIVGKTLAVDRLIKDAGCIDPVAAQGGEERHRAPMAIRHLGMKALSLGCPAPQWGHVGFCPGFINEDEARRIKPTLILLPLFAPPRDLWAKLFGGQHAFF